MTKLIVAFLSFENVPKKTNNMFDGFGSYRHGVGDFMLYRPSNPLFGASIMLFPLHFYIRIFTYIFTYFICVDFSSFL